MADGHQMTKTRPSSSVSPADMLSTDGGVNTSPLCDSGVLSPSQTGYAIKEFLMMPPEGKLKHFDSRAQAHEDNQEFDARIQDLVRCVALTRLVHGEGHLKLAQAHVRLAKAYFQLKGWGLQAMEHAALAREQLPFCSSVSCREKKLEILTCLLSIHLTQGAASLTTANLEEAESSFLQAEQVVEDLHQRGGISQEEKINTDVEISTGLSRVYRRQSRPEDALSRCEKSLQLLKDCDQLEKTCSVYRDMAAIEQDKGHLDRAIEHLTKAHAIAVSHSPEELEGAQISHSLALILSAAAEPNHNESAGHYFEQSLSAYENSAGPHDPAFLAAQDDYCRFLLFNGQQERCMEIQRASLAAKRSTFGELSAEVADTLQLIGSVEMTEGRMKLAHRTMTKRGSKSPSALTGLVKGSLSPHRVVTFPKYPDTEQICRDIRFLSSCHNPYSDGATCFSRGNLAHAVDTILLLKKKKAFHYINLSNGENMQEARWICSRLHSVSLSLCLEIQSLLYGLQHKKTKATKKAVDMLARAPEVAERQQRQGRKKTKPHTFSALPSSGNDGNSMSDS